MSGDGAGIMRFMRCRLSLVVCVVVVLPACFPTTPGDAPPNRSDASDRQTPADDLVAPGVDAARVEVGVPIALDSATYSGIVDRDSAAPSDAFGAPLIDAVTTTADISAVDAMTPVDLTDAAAVPDAREADAATGDMSDASSDARPMCPLGLALCGGICVDTTTSTANCGNCGAACLLACVRSACQDIAMLSAGDHHRCAALRDRSLRCWGDNAVGQLGTGDSAPASTWIPVAGLANTEEVSCGARFTCARATSGIVSCWGANDNGQLGDGSFAARATPSGVREVTDSVSVAAGLDHACSLGADRRLRCWGNNEGGALGANSSATRSSVPLEVDPSTMYSAVSAGFYLTCGLTTQRTVRCWGRNSSGQVGDGTTTDRRGPTVVPLPAPATQIAVGAYHVCALLADRRIACWGHNEAGALGTGLPNGSATPVLVTGIDDATFLAAGDYHTCAVRADGGVACWGLNDHGQVGDGTQTNRVSAVSVAGAYRAVALSLRGRHSCAIGIDGRASCWGANGSGELADGTRTDRLTPILIRW